MFDTLSNADLLSIYNAHAPKAATRFESRKIGESRTFKVLQAKGLTIEDAVKLSKADAPLPAVTPAAIDPLAGAKAASAARMVREVLAKTGPVAPAAVVVAKSDADFAAEYTLGKLTRIAEDEGKPDPIEAKIVEAGLTGKKLALFRLMLRADGVSEAEGCSELAWAGCSATMFRVYQAAEAVGFTIRKWKGADRKMRYAAAL